MQLSRLARVTGWADKPLMKTIHSAGWTISRGKFKPLRKKKADNHGQ